VAASPALDLNLRAARLCDALTEDPDWLRVQVYDMQDGARVIDCGVDAVGGLEAGRRMAEICLAGLGQVQFVPTPEALFPGLSVQVVTDQPVAACMAAQYAGWEISLEDYYAISSGPMRAAAASEELFDVIGYREEVDEAVGTLETGKLPSQQVVDHIAEKCGTSPSGLTLLVARTASQAGNVQVVSRSVETALHKLHELGFDLARVVSGSGTAPLPPVAADDLAGIGRTNDAILYGGEVTLHVTGDDDSLEQIGPKIPSCASEDHGQTFATIFARYDHDFYRIDRNLFSPAVVTLHNLDTGRTFSFGHKLPRVIHESFRG